ncbi:MAG: diaminopimelate epimerase [Acidobacteria bacterium]|nr:diaminopimelate epimerase [Acidobacteriota bacterium]
MIDFHKVHGLANDFIVIDANVVPNRDYASLASAICHRHTGIGADGMLVIVHVSGDEADFSLRFFNVDGSEAEMSGNGIRCAAAVLYDTNRTYNKELNIRTRSGIKTLKLRTQSMSRFEFEVTMGKPSFSPSEIPMLISEPLPQIINYDLALETQTVKITSLSVGNPHCVIFLPDFDRVDWRSLGKEITQHKAFPNQVNVEFVQVLSEQEISARFWERGVGETASSGTGSCAAAIASMINSFTERQVRVQTSAGELQILWRSDDNISLTGPAEIICQGRYRLR